MGFSRYIFACIILILIILIALHLKPSLLFSYKTQRGQFTLWSDRPIESGWDFVLDDALRRIKTSELYDERTQFRIFVCNDSWRLLLFTRNASVGGFTDTFTTRNIFIREVAVQKNQLVPPYGTLANARSRPLSYFIAHEATHVMQSISIGRFFSIRSPRWLVEGYADLIAKAGDFDFEENLQFFKNDEVIMSDSYARHGLYRRYHLMTQYAVANSDQHIKEIFIAPPSEDDILGELKETSIKNE